MCSIFCSKITLLYHRNLKKWKKITYCFQSLSCSSVQVKVLAKNRSSGWSTLFSKVCNNVFFGRNFVVYLACCSLDDGIIVPAAAGLAPASPGAAAPAPPGGESSAE